MKIKVVSVGKVKQDFVLQGEAEFLKRVRLWAPFEVKEIPTERLASLPEQKRQEEEAKLFLKGVGAQDYVVILDERGKKRTSQELAQFFREKMNEGTGTVVFGIGGATGWHPSVVARANLLLSLSPLTFTYQMSRLILVEQIYRAFTIVKGVPYHK